VLDLLIRTVDEEDEDEEDAAGVDGKRAEQKQTNLSSPAAMGTACDQHPQSTRGVSKPLASVSIPEVKVRDRCFVVVLDGSGTLLFLVTGSLLISVFSVWSLE
jgi:hypothetical protein